MADIIRAQEHRRIRANAEKTDDKGWNKECRTENAESRIKKKEKI